MSSTPPPQAGFTAPNSAADTEAEYQAVLEQAHKRLWLSFQQTAGSVAKLYRDGSSVHHSAGNHAQAASTSATQQSDPLWAAFQASAGSLTQFYKDTIEAMNTVQDKAVHYGYQKRRREMANRVIGHAARSKKAAAAARYTACGQQVSQATANANAAAGLAAAAANDGNVFSGAAATPNHQQQQQQLNMDAAVALELELEKMMLSDDVATSPLRPLKRRPPPTDDILEAIFIKRAKPS